jgi:hypothetical protein
MTALKRNILVIALVGFSGLAIYETIQTRQARAEVLALQQKLASFEEKLRQLEVERDAAKNQLKNLERDTPVAQKNPNELELLKLRGEVTRLRNESNDPLGSKAKSLLIKVAHLKQKLEETPGAKIPEMAYLTDADWLKTADRRLDSDANYRDAMASIRSTAEEKFGEQWGKALKNFYAANPGQPLASTTQLKLFFDIEVEDAILDRWKIISSKGFGIPSNSGMGDFLVALKEPVDSIFDSQFYFGADNKAFGTFLADEIGQTMMPVYQAFKDANNGRDSETLSGLLPYAKTEQEKSALQKLLLQESGRSN